MSGELEEFDIIGMNRANTSSPALASGLKVQEDLLEIDESIPEVRKEKVPVALFPQDRYISYIVQSLFMIKDFTTTLLSNYFQNQEPGDLAKTLHNIFGYMIRSHKQRINVSELQAWIPDRGSIGNFYRNFLMQIRKEIDRLNSVKIEETSEEFFVYLLCFGKILTFIETPKQENIHYVSVDKSSGDLNSALNEQFGDKTNTYFTRIPNILLFETNGNNSEFFVEKELYLDRFLIENSHIVEKKMKVYSELEEKFNKALHKEDRYLNFNGLNIPLSTIFDKTAKFLGSESQVHKYESSYSSEDITDASEMISSCAARIKSSETKLEREKKKLHDEMNKVFSCKELQNRKFCLHSVLVCNLNNYFYIFDPVVPVWRLYRDGEITEVSELEVLKDQHLSCAVMYISENLVNKEENIISFNKPTSTRIEDKYNQCIPEYLIQNIDADNQEFTLKYEENSRKRQVSRIRELFNQRRDILLSFYNDRNPELELKLINFQMFLICGDDNTDYTDENIWKWDLLNLCCKEIYGTELESLQNNDFYKILSEASEKMRFGPYSLILDSYLMSELRKKRQIFQECCSHAETLISIYNTLCEKDFQTAIHQLSMLLDDPIEIKNSYYKKAKLLLKACLLRMTSEIKIKIKNSQFDPAVRSINKIAVLAFSYIQKDKALRKLISSRLHAIVQEIRSSSPPDHSQVANKLEISIRNIENNQCASFDDFPNSEVESEYKPPRSSKKWTDGWAEDSLAKRYFQAVTRITEDTFNLWIKFVEMPESNQLSLDEYLQIEQSAELFRD